MNKTLYGFEIKRDGRRAAPGKRKTYNIQKLWQHNHEILNMSLLGWKPKAIATHLGITTQTVSNTINSDLGKQKLAIMRQGRDADVFDAQARIDNMLPDALLVYENIIGRKGYAEGAPLSLMKSTADVIVKDLKGLEVPKKIEGRHLHAHLTTEDISHINKVGKKLAIEQGVLTEESDA
ncbi:helix-turn-helix domain-containing protein [Candidatus Pacearchaeota archaeon]|nr:helix-turn-helix domain-containing protein [Candidatus Pacearchaeota archaeon]